MAEQMNRRDWLKQTTLGAGAMGAALGTALATGGKAAAADTMPKKKLGATGKEIPILVMGCSQAFDPVYAKLFHRAHADGVTYLDTAVGYAAGHSHSQIGPFVEQFGIADAVHEEHVEVVGLERGEALEHEALEVFGRGAASAEHDL